MLSPPVPVFSPTLMNSAGTVSAGLTPLVLELCLTLVTVSFAICFPRAGDRIFSAIESFLASVARRRWLAILLCGAVPCLIRLCLIPWQPIPQPWLMDDFSFLLAADTFASGRLTNPTPPLWMHFESFHITLHPTYMSMYFPAQGMILAAGKVVAGHPWFGVWASCGLMSAAFCWALLAWVPPGWALLAGWLAGLRLALFSYWMNTYMGGAVPALGGALVLGALGRLLHQQGSRALPRTRDFLWMAVGIVILANSRPYEGLLVCAPAVVLVIWSIAKRRGWKPPHLRAVAPALAVLVLAAVFMGYYNHRLFGNVFTLPYTVNRATYAVAPHFLWQAARPVPIYNHPIMQKFYTGSSPLFETYWFFRQKASLAGFLSVGGDKLLQTFAFFLNLALVPLLLGLPFALRDKRMRLPVALASIFVAGLAAETWFIPHYAAPATALLYLILVQCMRHLRAAGPRGRFLVRATPVLCAVLVVFRAVAPLDLPEGVHATHFWYGSRPIGLERARIAADLERLPGKQLAIVRYTPDHMFPEWVYNSADIQGSKVIWAREMDDASNRRLIDYFKDRQVWLVEADATPPRLSPYPENTGDSHLLVSDKR